MSRCLVIINPVSGGGRARRYAMELQWQLSSLFDHIEVTFTRGSGDATLFAETATKDHFDAVFCMGGDGTVNETVNGIARGGGTAKFGFVPVGTVNDLARALQIPLRPIEAIRALAHSKIQPVDLGRCNDMYFCNNIAAGIIPRVVEEVTPREKALLGPLAYFVRGGQALFTTHDYTFQIKTETEDMTINSPLVLALLTNCVSSFEKFIPNASVNDGYMRLIIFREYFIMDVLKILPLILSGSIYNSKYVTILETQKASIELLNHSKPFSTNMDGSKGPELPLSLEVLPGYLQVYVPDKDWKKKSSLAPKTDMPKALNSK